MTPPLRLSYHDYDAALRVALVKALTAERLRRVPGGRVDIGRLHRGTVTWVQAALDVANDGLGVRAALEMNAIRRARGLAAVQLPGMRGLGNVSLAS